MAVISLILYNHKRGGAGSLIISSCREELLHEYDLELSAAWTINCYSMTIVNMGAGAHKDGAVALLGQRTSEECLAGAGRAVQQD